MITSPLAFRVFTRLLIVVCGLLIGEMLQSWFKTSPNQKAEPRERLEGHEVSAVPASGEPLPPNAGVDAAHLASLRGAALLTELLPVLDKFSTEDFRVFGARWVVITEPGEFYGSEAGIWKLVLRHWCELDADGLFAWLSSQLLLREHAGFDALESVLQALLVAEPGRTLDWVKVHPTPSIIGIARNATSVSAEMKMQHGIPPTDEDFRRIARTDPESLLPFLDLTRNEFSFDPTLTTIEVARGWAEKDLQAALAWAGTLSDADRKAAIAAIGETMEPLQLVEFLKTQPASERYSLLWTAVQRLRGTDPMAALRVALEHARGEHLNRLWRPVLLEMAERDAIQARTLFHTMGWPSGTDDVLSQWADEDPKAAFAEVANGSWTGLGNTMFYKLCDWARKDYNAALEWAQSCPPRMREGALQGVLTVISEKGIPQLTEYAETLPQGEVKSAAVSILVSRLYEKDRNGMVQAIASSPGELRAELARNYYGSLQDEEQGPALEEILRTAPANEKDRARLAETLASRPNARTAALLASLPESAVASGVWGEFTSAWSQLQPVETSEWVATLPQGEAKDLAINGLINGILADSDAPSAWTWASSIADPKARAAALTRVGAEWLENDSVAAQAAISSDANLSADEKQSLLTPDP